VDRGVEAGFQLVARGRNGVRNIPCDKLADGTFNGVRRRRDVAFGMFELAERGLLRRLTRMAIELREATLDAAHDRGDLISGHPNPARHIADFVCEMA